MMTSVTLPSSSGPLNGGRFPSIPEGLRASSATSIGVPRPIKRSSSSLGNEFCKKRRKQSTPIRISNTEPEQNQSPNTIKLEGKPNMSESPEPNVRCLICQVLFEDSDQLQSHIISEHPPLVCKNELDDCHSNTPTTGPFMDQSEQVGLSVARSDMQWINELQNKEWNLPNLQFSATNPLFVSLPQFTQPESIPMRSIRIFNPDAFCELCNKEFCNKYFLKTHKANKHGIYTDTAPSDSMQPSISVPSLSSSVKLANLVPTLDSSTTKFDSKLIGKTAHSIANMFLTKPSEVTLPESELYENAATSNGLSSSSDSDKNYLEDQTAETRSPSNTQTESTSVKNEPDDSFQDTSSKMSSEQTNRELDLSYRLRRFGVMNPKAFCEICCKEYCNKYFLRTHKLKRHGIYVPDEKEKDSNNFNLSNNVQTSPLNLIMTEQNNIDCKTTSPSDISCEVCGIRFQNVSLAHLHNVSVHGKVSREQEEADKSIKKYPDKSPIAEVINEDLQKLQTMILQLNELDTFKAVSICNICNKDFENRFYLDAHMLSAHGMLLDNVADSEKATEPENTSNNNTMCDICGREFKNAEEMTKHVMECHSNIAMGCDSTKEDPSSGDKNLNSRISATGSHTPERRVSTNVTPTSSYCEICNKELCNKYFMKTHMQRMHGIEIENGAQIGGVVCDICNKELCSKYFLRVHKHNTHGIMECGSSLFTPRKTECEVSTSQQFSTPPEPDPALKPGDLADLSHKYFYHFTEVCTICSRRFRSTKWLKAHLITDHGQIGVEKWKEIEQQLQGRNLSKVPSLANNEGSRLGNGTGSSESREGMQHFLSNIFSVDENNSRMYQCSSCPFTTPLLPLLFVHEKSHFTEKDSLKCPVCLQNFTEREQLQRHLLKKHPFLLPSSYLDKEAQMEEQTSESGKDLTTKKEVQQVVNQDVEKKEKEELPASAHVAVELSSEIGQSLKDVAKKMQWPATYAIPQANSRTFGDKDQEETQFTSSPGYVMQAFLLEESTSERRVVPSVVFLPMLQKQPTPITITFTLTPA